MWDTTAYSEPYRHWVIENFAPPDLTSFTIPRHVDWVRYDNDCEKGKRTCNKPEQLGNGRLLFDWLQSQEVVEKLKELTGIEGLQADPELYGAGLHITSPGGYLNCHLDYALHKSGLERRVNVILFLNDIWQEEWGGALELYEENAREWIKRVHPNWNRAVVWEAGDLAYHGCQKTSQYSAFRMTAACYYLAPARQGCVRKRALYVPNRRVA